MNTCPYCGLIHNTTCPKIRAIEYYPDGSTKRVEFHCGEPVVRNWYPISPNVSNEGM